MGVAADAFTPGPWSVVEYGDGDGLAVHDSRGDWRVCFMATPGKDGDFEVIEANAHLIAAVPELYEALGEVMEWVNGWSPFDIDPEWAATKAKVTAAIAKARGEA